VHAGRWAGNLTDNVCMDACTSMDVGDGACILTQGNVGEPARQSGPQPGRRPPARRLSVCLSVCLSSGSFRLPALAPCASRRRQLPALSVCADGRPPWASNGGRLLFCFRSCSGASSLVCLSGRLLQAGGRALALPTSAGRSRQMAASPTPRCRSSASAFSQRASCCPPHSTTPARCPTDSQYPPAKTPTHVRSGPHPPILLSLPLVSCCFVAGLVHRGWLLI
jgi:hypothetical protein